MNLMMTESNKYRKHLHANNTKWKNRFIKQTNKHLQITKLKSDFRFFIENNAHT